MVRVKQTGPTKAQKDMMKQMASGNPMGDFMIPPEDMVHLPPAPDRNFQMFWPIRKYNKQTSRLPKACMYVCNFVLNCIAYVLTNQHKREFIPNPNGGKHEQERMHACNPIISYHTLKFINLREINEDC